MRSYEYAERNGQLEMVWRVEYEINLFEYTIFVRGTEDEMRRYMTSEIGHVGKYSACTMRELDAVDTLHLPVYIAPKD